MRVVAAGGHGKIALILERLLSQRGDSVAGLIRNPDHAADLQAAGAEALVVDLENASVDEVATYLQGADAVVFAAGAGPGSGAARKETVDRDAAILLADAAEAANLRRYLRFRQPGPTPTPPTFGIPFSPPTCAPRVQPTTTSAPAPHSMRRSCGPAT
jgi:uncharacterized protein YbjT (DUF2867 family)